MHYELEDYVEEKPLRVKCWNKCLSETQTYTGCGRNNQMLKILLCICWDLTLLVLQNHI